MNDINVQNDKKFEEFLRTHDISVSLKDINRTLQEIGEGYYIKRGMESSDKYILVNKDFNIPVQCFNIQGQIIIRLLYKLQAGCYIYFDLSANQKIGPVNHLEDVQYFTDSINHNVKKGIVDFINKTGGSRNFVEVYNYINSTYFNEEELLTINLNINSAQNVAKFLLSDALENSDIDSNFLENLLPNSLYVIEKYKNLLDDNNETYKDVYVYINMVSRFIYVFAESNASNLIEMGVVEEQGSILFLQFQGIIRVLKEIYKYKNNDIINNLPNFIPAVVKIRG